MLVIQLKSHIQLNDKFSNRKMIFKKNSSFFMFLKAKWKIKKHLLQEQEIWDLLSSISDQWCIKSNTDILSVDKTMENILKMKYIHRSDLINVLQPHVIFTEDRDYKTKLRYQKPRIKNIAFLHHKSEIFEQLKIQINKALVFEDKNTPFLLSDKLFQSMALNIETFQKNLPFYTFFDIRQQIGKYIVQNQENLVDSLNNKIAHVKQDPFFKPLNIEILHVSQLDQFIYLHLKPYKYHDISSFCAFYYNH